MVVGVNRFVLTDDDSKVEALVIDNRASRALIERTCVCESLKRGHVCARALREDMCVLGGGPRH